MIGISRQTHVSGTWLRAGAAAVALASLTSCSGNAALAHAASASPLPTLRSSTPSPGFTTRPSSLPVSPSPSVKPSASVDARPAKACTARQLTVSLAYVGAFAGTWAAAVRFHNVGATTCSLRGYPRVMAFDHPHHIAAYGSRSADVNGTGNNTEIGNPFGDETTCPDYPILEIAPPSTDTFTRLHLSGALSGSVPGTLSGCTGIFVHGIVAGAEGFTATP